jgi:hypothetical protein
MVIITLQQIIDERISFLKEQINSNNKSELNSTFQIQINAISSADESASIPSTSEMHSVNSLKW